MEYLGKVIHGVKNVYNELNPATLSGAIDVIVVEQPDGSLLGSPFHVRFGKLNLVRSREKMINIEINGELLDLKMKLGEAGEAFFVAESKGDVPEYLATSPLLTGVENLQDVEPLNLSDFKSEEKVNDEESHDAPRPVEDIHLPSSLTAATTEENQIDGDEIESETHTTIAINEDETEPANRADLTWQWGDLPEQNLEQEPAKHEVTATNSLPNTPKPIHQTFERKSSQPGEQRPKWVWYGLLNIFNKKEREQLDLENGMYISEYEGDENGSGGSLPEVDSATSFSNKEDNFEEKRSTEIEDESDSDGSKSAKSVYSSTNNLPALNSTNISPFVSPIVSDTETDVDTEIVAKLEKVNEDISEDKQDTEANDDDNNDEDEDSHGLIMRQPAKKTESYVNMPVVPDMKEGNTILSLGVDDSDEEEAKDKKLSDVDVDDDVIADTKVDDVAVDVEVNDDVVVDVGDGNGETKLSERESSSSMHVNFNADDSIHAIERGTAMSSGDDNNEDEDNIGNKDFDSDDDDFGGLQKGRDVFLSTSTLHHLVPSPSPGPHSSQRSSSNSVRFLLGSDDEMESARNSRVGLHSLFGIELSLCGNFLANQDIEVTFEENKITYEAFCESPEILSNHNLVIRMDNKYYDWKIAGPLIMSRLVFGSELPQESIDSLTSRYAPKKTWTSWIFGGGNATATSPISPRQTTPKAPLVLEEKVEPQDPDDTVFESVDNFNITNTEPPVGPRTTQRSFSTSSENSLDSLNQPQYCKTLRLSPDTLAKLNLKPGRNTARFSIVTKMQGTAQCFCNIYRWSYKDKIVISDIDGTITKSDALGHLLYALGKDWTHSGVAQLYSTIRDNGYKMLYLSSRAIGQADLTRYYLEGVKQEKNTLPEGPVLLSPDRLGTSFHREVIRKKPEEFKIACLSDIRDLFPVEQEVFYAGFGNRISDHISYKTVGVPTNRIFIINPAGQIKTEEHFTFNSSYPSLSALSHLMFSPIVEDVSEKFNDFNFWNTQPMYDVDLDLDLLNESVTEKKKEETDIAVPIQRDRAGSLVVHPRSPLLKNVEKQTQRTSLFPTPTAPALNPSLSLLSAKQEIENLHHTQSEPEALKK